MTSTIESLQARYGHAIFQIARYQKEADYLKKQLEDAAFATARNECWESPAPMAEPGRFLGQQADASLGEAKPAALAQKRKYDKPKQHFQEIAVRVRQLRRSSGLLQRELAAKCGLTQACVCRWEHAIESPTPATMLVLAELSRGEHRAWWLAKSGTTTHGIQISFIGDAASSLSSAVNA